MLLWTIKAVSMPHRSASRAEPSGQDDLQPLRCTYSLPWNLSRRRMEGAGCFFFSIFFPSRLHLIQKDRCDFQMRSFVSVSRWLTSPLRPATITVACGITPGGGGGDPLIYYGLSAGAARVTRTVSCVLIRAHPIRGGEERRRRSGVLGRSTKSPEMWSLSCRTVAPVVNLFTTDF